MAIECTGALPHSASLPTQKTIGRLICEVVVLERLSQNKIHIQVAIYRRLGCGLPVRLLGFGCFRPSHHVEYCYTQSLQRNPLR